MKVHGRWVIEVDVRKFFDTMKHKDLMDTVHRSVRDGEPLRIGV